MVPWHMDIQFSENLLLKRLSISLEGSWSLCWNHMTQDASLAGLSISSWVSFGVFPVSSRLLIAPELSDLLAQNCHSTITILLFPEERVIIPPFSLLISGICVFLYSLWIHTHIYSVALFNEWTFNLISIALLVFVSNVSSLCTWDKPLLPQFFGLSPSMLSFYHSLPRLSRP